MWSAPRPPSAEDSVLGKDGGVHGFLRRPLLLLSGWGRAYFITILGWNGSVAMFGPNISIATITDYMA